MSAFDTLLSIAGDVGGSFIGDPMLGNQLDMVKNVVAGSGGGGNSSAVGAGGAAAGGAAAGAAQLQEDTALKGYNDTSEAQQAYLKEVADQRNQALKNLAMLSMVKNNRTSPFDPAGPQQYDPALVSTLETLGKQGQSMLSSPAPTPSFTPLPLNAGELQKVTGTAPSPLQTIGAGLSAFGGMGGAKGAPAAAGAFPPFQNPVPGNAGINLSPGDLPPGALMGPSGFELPPGVFSDPSIDPGTENLFG